MPDKLVSVIIPTYNRAQSISEAIGSVKAQTYPAIQLIIADDGSQDNTKEIVSRFEGVEYYRQENKGQAAARNLGLKYARGDYIASLDSDDVWQENFLEAAVGALERFQADFVFLNWTEISENEKLISGWERSGEWKKYLGNSDEEWILLNEKEVRELFINTCPAPSSALLIRRSSLVSRWNEEMKIADDWYLILEMVLTKPCRAAFTLNSYWLKHIHSSNIYHGREHLKIIEELGLHDEPIFARNFKEKLTLPEKAVLNKRLCINHFNSGRLNWKHNGISSSALQSIATAFKISPFQSINYIMQRYFDHLKIRFITVQKKDKQPD